MFGMDYVLVPGTYFLLIVIVKTNILLPSSHFIDEEIFSIVRLWEVTGMCSQSLPSHGRYQAKIVMQFDICLSSLH